MVEFKVNYTPYVWMGVCGSLTKMLHCQWDHLLFTQLHLLLYVMCLSFRISRTALKQNVILKCSLTPECNGYIGPPRKVWQFNNKWSTFV